MAASPGQQTLIIVAVLAFTTLRAAPAAAQLKAQVPATITPAWNKGIQPISSESYWNAVERGKQGGERPACVFYDAGLCKNEDGASVPQWHADTLFMYRGEPRS